MPSVLLIEDDAKIRKFLRISLEANDFDVREVRHGQDGIEQVEEGGHRGSVCARWWSGVRPA